LAHSSSSSFRGTHLVLDTVLGSSLAQRFYFRQGLLSEGLHFNQALHAG
jgi:hypothetical protein